jgi:hypothetical protein
MLRNFSGTVVLALFIVMVALAGNASASSGSTSASTVTSTSMTSATSGTFSISVQNNIVVKQSQSNLMVSFTETNNSGSAAWCNVYIPELNYWVASSPFLLTTGQTGLGAPIPTTKKSSLTFELWCGRLIDSVPLKVASTTGMVTVAGKV